ncbi:hypothetical protein [Streptomyces sp. NPDC019507]|uniref:hypothetical protein n=1 Tax=Streptomyces sp. NPDC019507 TaxID=3154689 RepID=UPI0033FE45E7
MTARLPGRSPPVRGIRALSRSLGPGAERPPEEPPPALPALGAGAHSAKCAPWM